MGLILVVDDDEMVRDFVTAILATFGHDSVPAGDGVEALLAFQYLRHQISLVIMDIMMPRMDGIAVTKVIKEANPSAKVILMTGCPNNFRRRSSLMPSSPNRLEARTSGRQSRRS